MFRSYYNDGGEHAEETPCVPRDEGVAIPRHANEPAIISNDVNEEPRRSTRHNKGVPPERYGHKIVN